MPGPDALRGLSDAALITGIQDWARATAAADARRLAGIAELVARRCTDEHPDWACDDWDACAAEISCALTVGHGRASGQMDLAVTLRDRLPHIGALFLAGDLPTRTVDTITRRTALVTDHDALAALDTHLAEQAVHWGPLSQYKLEQAVDAAVQRHDPAAVRRTRYTTRGRDFTIGDPNDDHRHHQRLGPTVHPRRRPPPDRGQRPGPLRLRRRPPHPGATPRRRLRRTGRPRHRPGLPMRQPRLPRRHRPRPGRHPLPHPHPRRRRRPGRPARPTPTRRR